MAGNRYTRLENSLRHLIGKIVFLIFRICVNNHAFKILNTRKILFLKKMEVKNKEIGICFLINLFSLEYILIRDTVGIQNNLV